MPNSILNLKLCKLKYQPQISVKHQTLYIYSIHIDIYIIDIYIYIYRIMVLHFQF